MYRQILVPVQEPAEVEPLIRFAATLLDADGEIRMLHVIPTTTMPQVTKEWRASVNLVVPAHEAGAALDVRVEPEVRASTDVAGEILESAEAHQIDGILLSLGGDRRTRNPFVGHTASAVLHHAHADVLILNRLGLAAQKVPRVLVPTLHGPPPPRVMELAEQISIRNNAIPVVTIGLGPDAAGGKATEDRTSRGVPTQHHHSFVSTKLLARRRHHARLILQSAARERYGFLLVGEEHMNPEGPPLLTRPFLEELFRDAPCPVLALRT